MRTQSKRSFPASFGCLALAVIIGGVAPATAQQSTIARDADATQQSAANGATGATAAPAAASDTTDGFVDAVHGAVEFGLQTSNVDGDRPSKFEQNRQVREGFLFRRFRLASVPVASPFYLRVVGLNPSEDDQSYVADLGMYDRFHTRVEWTSVPFLFTRGARSLFSSPQDGQLLLPDALQQSFQSTADLALPGTVQNALNQAPYIDLKVTRESLWIDQRVNFSKHWSAYARFKDEKRNGNMPLGSGSYERIATATGDTFRVLSIELPEPVDYRTDEITLGTSYTTSRWGVNFDYTYSSFRNDVSTLVFDNPFAFVDQQANPGGGTNRMRFSRGIYDLAPDNSAHSFMVSGFVELPNHSRWASAVGWSFWRQDDDFVPFTLNTAITSTNLPAGITPTDLEALPERSLNGKVDTFSMDHVLAARISDSVAVNLHYRSYDYDNLTEVIEWPGYAAYGESYWRINIEFLPTLPTATPLPIESEPASFHRQNAQAEVVWDISKEFRFKSFYELETWNRTNRQANRTNEHSIGAGLDYRASRNFSASVDYRYSDRKPLVYDPGLLENSRLRMFDQAKRMRHEADALVNWRINSELAISASGSYLSEDYDGNFYGLTRYTQVFGSVDMLYNPTETSTIYASYSREHYNNLFQTISKTTIVTYDPANRWNRQTRDSLNTFTIGGTGYFAEDKLVADVHYALSFDNQDFRTTNITAFRPYDALNAQAVPWPDVETRYQELRADVSYQFTRNIGVGFRYIYEPYRLDDFSWNDLSAYPFEELPEENDGRRFMFLDSQYTGHDANVIGVYVRWSFGGAPEE